MKKEFNLDLIQRVTDNYFFWQGYRFVPFGVVFLIYALLLLEPDWISDFKWVIYSISLLAFIAAYYAQLKIGRYYHNQFGRVRPIPGEHSTRDKMKWFIFYPAIIGGLVLDFALRFPIFISGLVTCACIIGYWWSTGRGRKHYLLLATIMGMFSFLPIFYSIPDIKQLFAMYFGLFGFIYIIGGILDHRQLSKILTEQDLYEEN